MKDICLTALVLSLWGVAAFAGTGFVQAMSTVFAMLATVLLIERLTA